MKALYNVSGMEVTIATTMIGIDVQFGDIMSSDRDAMAIETKDCFDAAILSCQQDGKMVVMIGDDRALVKDTADTDPIVILTKDEVFGKFTMNIADDLWLVLSHSQQEELVTILFNGLIAELEGIEKFKRAA